MSQWQTMPNEATHEEMKMQVNDGFFNIMSLDGKTLLFSLSLMVMHNTTTFDDEARKLIAILTEELPALLQSHLQPKH